MAKQRNERTGAKVAAIAGRVLRKFQGHGMREIAVVYVWDAGDYRELCKWRDLKAVLASALTQAEDKISSDHATRGGRVPVRQPRPKGAGVIPKPRRRARRK